MPVSELVEEASLFAAAAFLLALATVWLRRDLRKDTMQMTFVMLIGLAGLVLVERFGPPPGEGPFGGVMREAALAILAIGAARITVTFAFRAALGRVAVPQILAEVLMEHWGGTRFKAYSAGSFPKGTVNPLAIDLLTQLGMPTAGMRSKSWDEFAVPGAPVMDFVFTVCDQAVGEQCPIWPGHPITAHWGVPDPADAEGSYALRMLAFRQAFAGLERRIKTFVDLRAALDRKTMQAEVTEIGQIDDHPDSHDLTRRSEIRRQALLAISEVRVEQRALDRRLGHRMTPHRGQPFVQLFV